MASKRILIIGGTGYIGKYLSNKLALDYDVVTLSKEPNTTFKNNISLDIMNEFELIKTVKSFDLVIVLAAIKKSSRKKKYRDNVIGLKNILSAMKKNNLRNIIYFSSQNIFLKNLGPYGLSKLDAEKLLKKSKFKYIIIRPNYVYSLDKYNNFAKIAKFISRYGFVIIPGSGNNKFRPVLREDLVFETQKLVRKFFIYNEVSQEINISGNKIMTVNQAIDSISLLLNKKPLKIHIPFFILKMLNVFVPFNIESFQGDILAKSNKLCKSSLQMDLKILVQKFI